jgi:hypothetical protein
MRMTRAEIAQLKEELTADYKRKLEALELVEEMLVRQKRSPLPTGPLDLQSAKVGPSAGAARLTAAARIEQAFGREAKWTIPALMKAIGIEHSYAWMTVNRLVKERKVRVSKRPSGRSPAEYERVAR